MSRRVITILIALISFSNCHNNSKERSFESRTNKKDSSDELAIYSADDQEMNAAQMEARRTYPEFLTALQNGCNGCANFLIKMRFSYGEANGEHIWIENLQIGDGEVRGTLANVPENIQNLNYADTVEVVKEKISDWKYTQNGKLVGGYTLRVMYNRMTEEEKRQFESAIEAKID